MANKGLLINLLSVSRRSINDLLVNFTFEGLRAIISSCMSMWSLFLSCRFISSCCIKISACSSNPKISTRTLQLGQVTGFILSPYSSFPIYEAILMEPVSTAKTYEKFPDEEAILAYVHKSVSRVAANSMVSLWVSNLTTGHPFLLDNNLLLFKYWY